MMSIGLDAIIHKGNTMIARLIKTMLVAGAILAPALSTAATAFETLENVKVSENITVIEFDNVKIHTFHGISNSHIIETPNELRMIDAQFIAPHAKAVRAYIETLGKPLVQVILSHNHPDHWFGASTFEDMAPIATSTNIADDLKNGGMRYIKIMLTKPKMKGSVPDKVIVPSEVVALGAQTWDGLDVIVEEYTEHESHNSLLIKIPSAGIMIGQDLFYNGFFLVASERKRNLHWRNLLQELSDNEAKTYMTLLVGHGQNGGPSILSQDITYLDALEATMEKGMDIDATTQSLIEQFPDKKGAKGLLNISMHNMFKGH